MIVEVCQEICYAIASGSWSEYEQSYLCKEKTLFESDRTREVKMKRGRRRKDVVESCFVSALSLKTLSVFIVIIEYWEEKKEHKSKNIPYRVYME